MIKAKTIKNKKFVEKSVEVEALVIPLHLSPRQLKRGNANRLLLVAHEPFKICLFQMQTKNFQKSVYF